MILTHLAAVYYTISIGYILHYYLVRGITFPITFFFRTTENLEIIFSDNNCFVTSYHIFLTKKNSAVSRDWLNWVVASNTFLLSPQDFHFWLFLKRGWFNHQLDKGLWSPPSSPLFRPWRVAPFDSQQRQRIKKKVKLQRLKPFLPWFQRFPWKQGVEVVKSGRGKCLFSKVTICTNYIYNALRVA